LADAMGVVARSVDGRAVRLGRPPFEPKLERLERILRAEQTRAAVSIRLDGRRREGRATVVLPKATKEGGR